MHTTLQIIELANSLPAEGGISDWINGKITSWTGISKIGIPVIVGVGIFIYGLINKFKMGKIIGLAVAGALVVYITVGGGLKDLSDMGKQEITSTGPVMIRSDLNPNTGGIYDG